MMWTQARHRQSRTQCPPGQDILHKQTEREREREREGERGREREREREGGREGGREREREVNARGQLKHRDCTVHAWQNTYIHKKSHTVEVCMHGSTLLTAHMYITRWGIEQSGVQYVPCCKVALRHE